MNKERIPCPINNGADLHADAMLENLFDDMVYVESAVNKTSIALGFIDGTPVKVEYWLGRNALSITAVYGMRRDWKAFGGILENRLADEQVEPELIAFYAMYPQHWQVFFHYKEEYARDFRP